MLHAGLDLSRKRLDVRVLDDAGDTALETWTPADRDGLDESGATRRRFAEPVRGVIEAMNGARFVHDHLEQRGWDIEIADAATSRDWRRWRASRPHRRMGARRAVAAGSGARDLAAQSRGAPGTGTGPLAVASRQAPHCVEEPGALDPDRVRLPETRVGSLRCRRPCPARGARVPRTVALQPGRGAATDRRARHRHHRL